MKTYAIEIEKVRAMSNAQGLIRAQIDARVQPASNPRGDAEGGGTPATTLSFTEDTARVLLLLLKAQLAEFDARKARSRR